MKPKRIIIHHSLTGDSRTVSWNAIRRYHKYTLRWNDIGYHYGIELVGSHYEVLLGRMMNVQGAHTRGYNQDSLGICFVGDFDDRPPASGQWELGIRLVKSLIEVLEIPVSSVLGHHELASWKSCPGEKFNMGLFRKELLR